MTTRLFSGSAIQFSQKLDVKHRQALSGLQISNRMYTSSDCSAAQTSFNVVQIQKSSISCFYICQMPVETGAGAADVSNHTRLQLLVDHLPCLQAYILICTWSTCSASALSYSITCHTIVQPICDIVNAGTSKSKRCSKLQVRHLLSNLSSSR